jgi:hypothetical protein
LPTTSLPMPLALSVVPVMRVLHRVEARKDCWKY